MKAIVPVVSHEETNQVHCGPGPFSMAGPDMVSVMLRSAGFERVAFERYDCDICIGRDLADAVEDQVEADVLTEVVVFASEFIGKVVNYSRRWIPLGFMNFQPSELAKLGIALYAASYMVRKMDVKERFFKAVLPMGAAVALAGVFLLAEPDMGAFMVIAAIAMGILFLGGVKRVLQRHQVIARLESIQQLLLFLELLGGDGGAGAALGHVDQRRFSGDLHGFRLAAHRERERESRAGAGHDGDGLGGRSEALQANRDLVVAVIEPVPGDIPAVLEGDRLAPLRAPGGAHARAFFARYPANTCAVVRSASLSRSKNAYMPSSVNPGSKSVPSK